MLVCGHVHAIACTHACIYNSIQSKVFSAVVL